MTPEEEKKRIGSGLRLQKQSKKDYSHSRVFGKVEKVPYQDFRVAEPLGIKDQGTDDSCASQATAALMEAHEKVKMNPYWLFKEVKKRQGSIEEFGSTIKEPVEVAVDVGCIEKDINLEMDATRQNDRDYLANWENWPKAGFDETGLVSLEENAKIHRQKSFFKPDGYGDRFDDFWFTLWANRAIKQGGKGNAITTGTLWRQGWLSAKDGIIPEMPSQTYYGHALAFIGGRVINGKPYLEAQLSNGDDVGAKGLFYFSRNIINRDFTYEALLTRDMPAKEAHKRAWSLWRRIWAAIKRYFKGLII